MNKAISDLKRGLNLYHVWLYQAYYNLSAKYKRTVFGSLWIAGNMVFTSVAISLVWGGLWGKTLAEVMPYALAGNLLGTTCLFVLYDAGAIFVGSSGMIVNHAYPFTYFIFEGVAEKLMLFFHNLIVYYVFMLVLGAAAIPNWSVIPGFVLVVVCMLTWGGLVGMLSARFRDLRFLLPNIGHIMFFVTPIYWHYDMLQKNQWVADINPLYALVTIVRAPLMGGAATPQNWTMAIATTVIGVTLFAIFFSLYRRRIPFWV
ncbi:hypothetical protein MMA231_03471 (plasmid) [Asticcacaulis sp. MM231]|uniref:ABC transporter permease n=1 Tax=Asticcacaulis sp. MM231 TaxID=3157666 RepID=UPI0032D5A99A